MIDLYTAATPNGFKASIMLEETGLPYRVHPLDLHLLEQKQDWYLKINPNGRIPAIVDREEDDFPVFESGAILVYLAEKTGMLLPPGRKRRSTVLQWLMFQMGGVGPMQGQANVFYRYAPEKIPYAIERYQKEVRRLYAVLDARLMEREFLADDYSIADIASFPWVAAHTWSGVALDGLPHLERWLARMQARPAVAKGMTVPKAWDIKERDREFVERARNMLV